MSFGLKVSFGRLCKGIKITGRPYRIVRASGKTYEDYDIIESPDGGRRWFITPDGQSHDDLELEFEDHFEWIGPHDGGIAIKSALEHRGYHPFKDENFIVENFIASTVHLKDLDRHRNIIPIQSLHHDP